MHPPHSPAPRDYKLQSPTQPTPGRPVPRSPGLDAWGSSINHVVKILGNLDPSPPFVVTFTKYGLCYKMVIWLTPFPFNCPRGLWMTPYPNFVLMSSMMIAELNARSKCLIPEGFICDPSEGDFCNPGLKRNSRIQKQRFKGFLI